MKQLLTNIDTDLTLFHLTADEAAAPIQVLQDYCDDFTPGKCRTFLQDLVKTALIYDETYNNTASRERLLLWEERTLKFLEAGYAQQQLMQDLAEVRALPVSGFKTGIA